MASSSKVVDLAPEPDLCPLYPSAPEVSRLLSASSGLTPEQKAALVSHCMMRASVFGDLAFFQYILRDPQAHPYLDLNYQDEDGLVYPSIIILGFGSESDRDVEREECVRLLASEGADVNIADKASWTPLHHAALLAPPTLISFLLTHGCSPLTMTRRQMTALDLVTAYAVIPGREDVALFLEEAMRGEGWQNSKMVSHRKLQTERLHRDEKRQAQRVAVMDILGLSEHWWRQNEAYLPSDASSPESEDEGDDTKIFTPPLDYSSMLVFSPESLQGILDNLISNFCPISRNSDPANTLYMLARFACLTSDHTWLEDLVMSATDAIEDVAFNHPDDLTYTIFWLYNCTVWLHFMRCDNAIRETCELLGSFELIEEIINTVYVLIIRVAERRIDKLIDSAILDYSPAEAELDQVQFESEWSIFRSPFSSKKKVTSQGMTPSSTAASLKHARPTSPVLLSPRPSSPTLQQGPLTHTTNSFSSLRQRTNRSRAISTSLHGLLADRHRANNIQELVLYLTALHLLLTDSGINPAIITQLWSQVIYWTSSEVFNRILTRKRYICRSRAIQIGLNLSILEEWIEDAALPIGVLSHLVPARELLIWLQCLSSMDDFSKLIATIQTLKHLNPLQMRRAVRDYRYEVSELRMNDDCSQYLAQLQKDWERQRVKLGVEALRKEINERGLDYDDDDSFSSEAHEANGSQNHDKAHSISSADGLSSASNVDFLFGVAKGKSPWVPQQPPEVLGELLESRYMLPLQLPSDPAMLAAVASEFPRVDEAPIPEGNSGRVLNWVAKGKLMRQVHVEILDRLDGSAGLERRSRRQRDVSFADEVLSDMDPSSLLDAGDVDQDKQAEEQVHLTRLSRTASSRSKQGRNRAE